MSADAVAAVRAGLRTVLSRASRPLTGASFCSGQPSAPASGLMRYLLEMATATKTSTAPKAIVPRREVVVPGPYMPPMMPTTPSTATIPATTGMKRANRPGGSTEPSCSAAIGGTRVARAAGTIADSSVTIMPTASDTMTVRGASTRPLCGMSMLAAWKSWMTPAAMPRPARMPRTEASRPMTSASAVRLVST